VCFAEQTESVMTEPGAFSRYIVAYLEWLDGVLPPGSHVLLLGLAAVGLWALVSWLTD